MIRLSKNRLAFLASLNLQNLTNGQVINIWIKYETEIHVSIKKHGKQYTLGRFKESYTFLRNYLLKLPTQPIPFCKADSLGIPKPLWSLRPLIKGDRDAQRVALTIARSYEQIRLPIDYSTVAITDDLSPLQETNVLELLPKFNKFLTKFTRKRKWYLGSLQDPVAPWSKVLTTLSKGPNGPAVASSHLDAKAVTASHYLYHAIKRLNNVLGQDWITDWMIGQSETVKEGSYYTGRLGFSSEPAGKTRIFAIGDYWSQLSLKPLQISLQKTLSQISTDSTSNQDKGFKSLIAESCGKCTYCFDLSSASDRIPAIMQKHRLRLMGGQDLSESWYTIMTDRDFYVKSTKSYVRWKVGQPLGLLSSFPSFALWHHDIVQFAANWENFHNGKPLRFFKQYRILGDDIVIFNTKVARRYQIILEKIGLTINLQKSIIGDKERSQIEFAKRLSLNGKEMSSIKHNILSKNNIVNMLDLVEILRERDFISPDTGHYGLHRVLKSEDLLRLQYLFWLRSSVAPTFSFKTDSGNATLMITRKDVIQRIISKRTQNIIEKAMKIRPLDMETMFPNLVKGFSSIGVPYSEKALADRSIGDLSGSHPIVLALTQTSRELQFLMFTVLDDLEPDTVSPVEYLPIVDQKGYYYDRKAITAYLSKILLDSFNELRDEAKLAKVNIQ